MKRLSGQLHCKWSALSQYGFRPPSQRDKTSHGLASFLHKSALKQFDGSASLRFCTSVGNAALSIVASRIVPATSPFKHKYALRLLSIGNGRAKQVCKTSTWALSLPFSLNRCGARFLAQAATCLCCQKNGTPSKILCSCHFRGAAKGPSAL